jgi:gamma-glutamyl-gamma-aminobutyrate hydrolase PuuD
MNLPLIAMSTYVEKARFGFWDEPAALVPISYVSAVTRAGGHPVLLPPSPWGPGAVLGVVDALVLTGGPDVGPATYGAEPHERTDQPRQDRDSWEIALCHHALEHGLPLLAICRGLQVLNVAMGGTLHQHLPEVVGHDDHRPVLGQSSPNQVTLKEGSRAGSILGPRIEGHCHHHQAVDRLGEQLEAVGFADDGTVEAVEVLGAGFALGVQWHPEDNPADDRLLVALVHEARHRRDALRSGASVPLARQAG